MSTVNPGFDPSSQPVHVTELRRAQAVSAISVAWTVTASAVALVIGLVAHSLVLVAFALSGAFDALGSVALVEHFRRARRLGGVSARLERAILRLVAFGMWGVAASTGVQSVMRLASGDTAEPTLAGMVLAGVSMVVLTLLARRKATLGRAVHSAALVADSQLTAVGAALACITVLGTAGTTALGWSWLDPAAALLMSCALVAVGASVAKQSARPNSSTARRRRG